VSVCASTGKLKHADRDEAARHLRQLVARDRKIGIRTTAARMTVFLCPKCKTWHVGHRPNRYGRKAPR